MIANQDLLVNLYRAFNARDMDALLVALHAEVDWPNGWEGGRVSGRQGVRDYWTRQWQAIVPHVEPFAFDNDAAGDAVVQVHQVVRDLNGNLLLETDVVHVYRIEDGLIRSMEIRSMPA